MAPPSEIGDYKVIRPLGHGGMGEVYLAHDPGLDRLVAIKVIAGVRDHAASRARFAVEARAIGRLKHPNVVTVHHAGEIDGRPYLVSEYVEGTPLDRLERVSRERAIAIGLQLARGLAAAHRENILHRDVKPANAILDRDGVVKLLDFGLAKLANEVTAEPDVTRPDVVPAPTAPTSSDDTPVSPPVPRGELSTITFSGAAPVLPGQALELTAAGSQLGTPRYMAPEAWQGHPLTAASDVYSLGIVLWELVAGRHPFEGLTGEAQAACVCAEDAPGIRTATPELPVALATVIDRCVRRAPDERYADAATLLIAFEIAAAPARTNRRLALVGGAVVATGLAATAFLWSRDLAVTAPPVTARRDAAVPTAPAAPRALTALGGCAELPSFIDGATIAFGLAKGNAVDVMTTTGSGTPISAAATDGWEWRPTTGRLPGELLYIQENAEGKSELVALDRASSAKTALAVAFSAVVAGDAIYLVSDDKPGEIGTLGTTGIEWIARTPPAKSPYVLAGTTGSPRVAIVVADPESPPGVCILELADRSVRCPATERLQNGRPAMTRDGRFLYYPARAGIRRLDLEAGTDRVVVPDVRASGGIALSPDERRLVFSDCRTYGSIVAVGTASAGAPEALVGRGFVVHPAGGPDGWLAWVAQRDGGGTRLVVRAPGKPERELANAATEIGRAAFDRTGAMVAYSIGGDGGGVRTIPIAGGEPTTWTSDPGDRAPVWLAGGGLAFTRSGVGGAPAVVVMTAATATPRVVVAGWVVEDVEPKTRAALLVRKGRTLAMLDVTTGALEPVALGAASVDDIIGARISPVDGALFVLGGANGGTFLRVERGAARVVYEVPAGQTAGPPTMLSDGRIAFRPEIWLGELYELEGAWADLAQPR